MISNFIFKHHTKDIELMVSKDAISQFYILVILDGEKGSVKKKFIGEWQYKQFLIRGCLFAFTG